MGKKKKSHRSRVASRNIRQEEAAWAQWEAIEAMLKEKGYDSPEEAIEAEPKLAPILLPFVLRAYKLTTQNMKKYGDGPV